MTSPETLVKLSNVAVVQESTEILRDVNLEIERGLTAIVGPSGAGKSTLALVVNGLMPPTEGSVAHADFDGELNPKRRFVSATKIGRFLLPQISSERKVAKYRAQKLGFIAQSPYIDLKLKAKEYIYLPHLARGNSLDENWVDDLVGVFEMEGKMDSYPSQLSGGEQQRVAIIAALAHKPDLVVADEPTSALDSRMADLTFQIFDAVRQETDTSFVFVSHDEAAANKYSDITVRMKDGVVESVRKKTDLHNPTITSTGLFDHYQ